jgi:hypothetical protein
VPATPHRNAQGAAIILGAFWAVRAAEDTPFMSTRRP